MKAEGKARGKRQEATRQRGPHPRPSASSAALSTKPGSSTKLQHQTLAIVARRAGLDIHEVRKMVGGSLRRLSVAKCSAWIERLGGGKLPNPPGRKPGAYAGKKREPGVIRIIHPEHIEEIRRLGLWIFAPSAARFYAWLYKNFKVNSIEDLATAERAGQVIRVLKGMLKRKESHNGMANSE